MIWPRCLGLTAAVAAMAAGAAAGGTGTSPACFGAAARDPQHPCHNTALDQSVTPSVVDSLLTPDAPCAIVRSARPLVCTFGRPRSGARRDFASIGDSHSAHWRAALTVVADANGWHGYQLYQTSCPFSLAPTVLRPLRFRECQQWRHDVIAWMRAHPAVDTVVVSEHRVHVQIPAGASRLRTEVSGYLRAWAALPATVRHIVVIRDTPYNFFSTNRCIAQALRGHHRPGIVCQIPIGTALRGDPAAVAARRLHSARVRVVDLTHYFCSARFCFPVIGGVRVHKDDDHITRVYSTSLGPYLRRAIARALNAPGT
jgi:hypothetical protein